MDDLILCWNVIMACLMCVVLTWCVFSRRIYEGVIVKFGLICMIIGFAMAARAMTTAEGDFVVLLRSISLINVGFFSTVAGYLMRYRLNHHPVRRSTDWAHLMDTQPMEAPQFDR